MGLRINHIPNDCMRTVVTLSLLKSLNLVFTVSFMKVLTGFLLCSLVFWGCDSSSSSSSDREIGGNGGEGAKGGLITRGQ